ncbi:hotdog family protein [Porticoccaceae bacterium]|nr:hotdog family protein [Porticoccaceae bacterium]MDB4077723.1 hotdog family protein [Porticoccaceae bacterium]
MTTDYSVIDVIPHGAPMSLLDDITSYTDTGLEAEVTIKESSLFCEEYGVPAWIGVEYMGQAVAAWAGVQARSDGRPVKIGFLVSTRRYESPVSHFPLGSQLKINVEQLTDNITGLRVFTCTINLKDIEIQANLNVFMPDNLEEFL